MPRCDAGSCGFESYRSRHIHGEPLPKEGRSLGLCLFNPHPNPQFAYPCATCAAFGSPRALVSCCKTISRSAVTAEVTVPAGLETRNAPMSLREWLPSGRLNGSYSETGIWETQVSLRYLGQIYSQFDPYLHDLN